MDFILKATEVILRRILILIFNPISLARYVDITDRNITKCNVRKEEKYSEDPFFRWSQIFTSEILSPDIDDHRRIVSRRNCRVILLVCLVSE